MRVYALLLGIALTTGYAYAAQMAVSSVGGGRHTPAEPAGTFTDEDAIGRVWYGGVLAPVTVESKSGGARVTASKGRILSRPTVRCVETSHSGFRAIS